MDEAGANSGLLSSASAAIPPGREAGVKYVGIVCDIMISMKALRKLSEVCEGGFWV